jgi:hypothetical protein
MAHGVGANQAVVTVSTMHVWVIVGRVGKAAVMGVTDLG